MGKNYYLKDRDILDQALEHSWGKTADAKAKEKAYNREYYQRHKEEILRKARQAGEGIRREANALKDIAEGRGSDRRPTNRNAYVKSHSWYHGKGTAYSTVDPIVSRNSARGEMKRAKQRADEWAERYKDNVAKGFKEAAAIDLDENRKAYTDYRDSKDKYDVMRKAAISRSHAEDEVARERQGRGAERRFDSKLARDAQNAYSKLRNPKEMVRRAGESTKAYIDNAMGKNGRRGAGVGQEEADRLSRQSKDQRSRANRFRDSARKSVQRSNSSYQQYQDLRDNPNTKGYAPQAYDNAVNEAHRAIEYAGQYAKNAKRSAASAAAANAASNAANRPGYDTRYDSSIVRGVQNTKAKARGAMSKAEKAAQQAREDAKKRMKKWFKR